MQKTSTVTAGKLRKIFFSSPDYLAFITALSSQYWTTVVHGKSLDANFILSVDHKHNFLHIYCGGCLSI